MQELKLIARLGSKAIRTGDVIVSRPSIPLKIRILDAEAEAALRTLVELVPEAESGLLNDADVASAVGAGRWIEVIYRNAFRGATAVVGRHVSVSTDAVQRERGGAADHRWS